MDSKISVNLIKNWQEICDNIVFVDIAPLLLQYRIITVNEYQQITSQSESSRIETLLLLLLKRDETVLLKFGDCLEKDYKWLAEKLKEDCTKNVEEGRDETDAKPVTHIKSVTSFESDVTTEDEKEMCVDCNNLNNIKVRQLNNKINIKGRKFERRGIIKPKVKNNIKLKVQNSEHVSSTTDFIKEKLNEEVTNEAITIVKNSLVSKSWTTIAHSLGLTDRVHDIRFKVTLYGEDLNMCVVYLIRTWLEMSPKIATLSRLIEVLRAENFNRVADQLTEILHGKPVTASCGI